jgi:hypothetical protein
MRMASPILVRKILPSPIFLVVVPFRMRYRREVGIDRDDRGEHEHQSIGNLVRSRVLNEDKNACIVTFGVTLKISLTGLVELSPSLRFGGKL